MVRRHKVPSQAQELLGKPIFREFMAWKDKQFEYALRTFDLLIQCLGNLFYFCFKKEKKEKLGLMTEKICPKDLRKQSLK